jgi:hypothetical protein
MNAQKFHRELGFEHGAIKEIFDDFRFVPRLSYNRHAKMETIKDALAIVPVIKKEDVRPEDVFEYTREGLQITKFVIRVSKFDNAKDFCYAIDADGTVLTVWANDKDDLHETLKPFPYERVTA